MKNWENLRKLKLNVLFKLLTSIIKLETNILFIRTNSFLSLCTHHTGTEKGGVASKPGPREY